MPHINRKCDNSLPTVKFNGTIVPRKQITYLTYNTGWHQYRVFEYAVGDFTPFSETSYVYAADGKLLAHSDLSSKDNIKGYSGGCAIVDSMRKTGYDDVPRIRTYECLSSVGYVLLPF